MSYFFENSAFINNFFIKELKKNTILQFKKITKKISYFKLTFLFLFLVEFFFSWFFIQYSPKSWFIAINIAIVILTVFLYFVLLFYFQSKKPQEIRVLKERLISSLRKNIAIPQGASEHHLSMSYALVRISFFLTDFEYNYFSLKKMVFLKPFFEFLSIYFHRKDVFKMREEFLILAIKEHIFQIKESPTDLEVHVSLARVYVLLAKLYKEALLKKFPKHFLNKKNKYLKSYEKAISLAIEEFNILKSFAPNDPWILSQLAKNYRTLDLLEEEAKEYEALLELSSNDNEVLFNLAKVYFELGRNAEGFAIYEELKNKGFSRKDDLLNFYFSARTMDSV